LDFETEDNSSTSSFWTYLEHLVATFPVIIDRPKNSQHPHYTNIVYPLDYGYLDGTTSIDGGGVDVWLGAAGTHDLNAVILTIDLQKHDAEIKVLLGCTEIEMQRIVDFHNTKSMQALLVRRKIT
jgi:inorganic pyrophosphatase